MSKTNQTIIVRHLTLLLELKILPDFTILKQFEMDLSFLSSHSSANNSDHSGSLPSDLGFRSDAAAATSNLHTDTGFILPRVQDVSPI